MLLTHLVVREDAHLLFGFATRPRRARFRQLLKISGVGARTALSVLSGMSVGELAQAVTTAGRRRLTRVPGIGKKTAERLLLELKDKLGADRGAVAVIRLAAGTRPIRERAARARLQRQGSAGRVKNLPAGSSVSEGIRQALKALSKADGR